MQHFFHRHAALYAWLALTFIPVPALAEYKSVNLVSNQAGKAKHRDKLLINAWGLAYTPGQSFWISDAGSGKSTLYNGSGAAESLIVTIPPSSGTGPGSPTGIVANTAKEFNVQGSPSVFMFATLDGTISGWAPSVSLTNAFIAVDNSATHASYTGLAITAKKSGNFIYAADTANNKVDMYDSTFTFVKSFTDATVPVGYVVSGIQDIKGQVYVAYVSGSGHSGGYIDIFKEDGTFVKLFTKGSPLNQPWGFALAPKNFGSLSNTLLISNNTNSGTINGFNFKTGKLVGTVKDSRRAAIKIDQLWGIEFGGGTSANGAKNQLFWTAGPNNNKNGLFGVISLQQQTEAGPIPTPMY